MATMPPCMGKSNAEIWAMFKDAHLSSVNPEPALRAIHSKWVKINAEVSPLSRRLRREAEVAAAKKR